MFPIILQKQQSACHKDIALFSGGSRPWAKGGGACPAGFTSFCDFFLSQNNNYIHQVQLLILVWRQYRILYWNIIAESFLNLVVYVKLYAQCNYSDNLSFMLWQQWFASFIGNYLLQTVSFQKSEIFLVKKFILVCWIRKTWLYKWWYFLN